MDANDESGLILVLFIVLFVVAGFVWLSIRRVGTRPPVSLTPRIAVTVASAFSERRFHNLFDDQPMAQGWTVADGLAVWYALGHICLIGAVGTATGFDKTRSYDLLDQVHGYLSQQWGMSEAVLLKYVSFLQENAGSVAGFFGAADDPRKLAWLSSVYVSRILGGTTAFSPASPSGGVFEAVLRGETINSNVVLHATVSKLYLDTATAVKTLLMAGPR